MRQQKINYQKELEKTLEAIWREERVPTLFCFIAAVVRAAVM